MNGLREMALQSRSDHANFTQTHRALCASMTMWPISTLVNAPENDDASLRDRWVDARIRWGLALLPESLHRAKLGAGCIRLLE
jgi:hypothetical protein